VEDILSVTGDEGSRACYRRLVERCPVEVVYEALSLVKDDDTGGW